MHQGEEGQASWGGGGGGGVRSVGSRNNVECVGCCCC